MQAEEEPFPIKHSDLMNFVFANRSKENTIYPLRDKRLDRLSLLEAYKPQLVENVQVLCKDNRLVIPQELQQRAVLWYHHYLQHPGTTRLKETLCAAMHWKDLRRSVRTFVKNCHKCQVNKRRQHKNGKLPRKLVVSNPCGRYYGKDGTDIDFMSVTMIDPATSWFKSVELLRLLPWGCKSTNTHNKPKEAYFDKSSAQVCSLVNKIWFSYPCCQVITYNNGSKFKLNFKTLFDLYSIKRNPTSIKNPQANAIL
eukprot:CCRYP_016125-RB/>CCRYP_016125-RB protein AED:0.30 eAED:0.38 QI:0/0/0/1/0/0/3/0/253